MAKPPMPDTVTLHVEQFNADGTPVLNRYGQAVRTQSTSKARVKYTAERVFNTSGSEAEAVLEVALPPETEVHSGDIVEWVDRFGVTVKEPIISLKEVLSYSGKVVYYRKAWAGEK
jgi:hypothetical protein